MEKHYFIIKYFYLLFIINDLISSLILHVGHPVNFLELCVEVNYEFYFNIVKGALLQDMCYGREHCV